MTGGEKCSETSRRPDGGEETREKSPRTPAGGPLGGQKRRERRVDIAEELFFFFPQTTAVRVVRCEPLAGRFIRANVRQFVPGLR